VKLEELENGSVRIVSAPSYPMRIISSGATDEDFEMTLIVSQPGNSVIASGDADATSYAYSLPVVDVTLTEFLVDAEPFEMEVAFGAQGVGGTFSAAEGPQALLTNALTIDGLAMRLEVEDPQTPGSIINMTFSLDDLVTDSTGTMSSMSAAQPLGALLAQGMTSRGGMRHGQMLFSMSATGTGDDFTLNGSVASGTLEADLGDGGLTYGGSNRDIALALSGASIPFPSVGFTIAESSGEISMPLTPSDEAAQFGLTSRISGLEMDEQLWALFDPTGVLPRDPASLLIDISGLGNWFVDITDPAQAQALENSGAMPGQLEGIALNALRLSLLGTELNGTGDFAFDNSGDVPAPEGTITLTLEGSNALIDKLIGMGLVPEDQAMGARMMLGLFARPTGEDELTSTIQFNPDGSVLANGQRIR
ncbi:MAG: DUF2125 domain-containing protein, partial [Alphaproteobacteria bacterium]|nr:DUF2125 domain-containing protein [Alphaproteobacteria bacterium]